MNLKAQLISKVRKEFPEIKFKKVKLITEGWDHDVLLLDDRLIFRFAKNKRYKQNFEREVKFLKQFFEISDIKVPDYIYLGKDKTFGGYYKIAGKELAPRLYRKLSKNKKQRLIQDIAKFLTTLHNFPIQKAKKLGFEPYLAWTEQPKWMKNKFQPKVRKYLTEKQNAFVKNFTQVFSKSLRHTKSVLGHYDLGHDHIFIDKNGRVTGIIDFGDINLSDPARELSGFYDIDKNLPKQIYKYYRGPKDPEFLERAKKHNVHKWIFLLYESKINRKHANLFRPAIAKINHYIKIYGS